MWGQWLHLNGPRSRETGPELKGAIIYKAFPFLKITSSSRSPAFKGALSIENSVFKHRSLYTFYIQTIMMHASQLCCWIAELPFPSVLMSETHSRGKKMELACVKQLWHCLCGAQIPSHYSKLVIYTNPDDTACTWNSSTCFSGSVVCCVLLR